MFIRPCYRTKDGKRHAYWALVESYRSRRGPRQRTVAYLGQLDQQVRLGVQQAAEGHLSYQRHLAPPPKRLRRSREGGFDDVEPEWVQVDFKRIRVERCLDFGGPWLAMQLLDRLELPTLLSRLLSEGREQIPWSVMAVVLVIARLCDPSSELYSAEHFYKRTALCELLAVPAEKIDDDRLYRALDRLLPHKAALETHLKKRMGQLFDLDYDLLLYDVTSSYFEGLAKGNPLAQYGYSRDRRGDCKQSLP